MNLKKYLTLDSIGFSASFLCAVHCAFMPLLLTAMSYSALNFLAGPIFEISIVLLSITIGISSLLPSYFKHHRKITPIMFLMMGFSMIFLSHFILPEDYEPVIAPLGAILIAYSHLVNMKLSKEKECLCIN